MKRLENKTAIITGAAGGMGAAEAKLFASEGAKVVITDIQEEKLKTVVDEIRNLGGIAEYILQDVSSEQSWIEVATKTELLFGKIDILVNNAGITGNLLNTIEERTVEEFNRVIGVNLLSQFLGVKTIVPYMRNNKGGSIINISSIGGIIGSANATAYTASKGGSRSFTKGAAAEFAKDNIRVNSVHPGYVATPMTKEMSGAADFQQMAVGATPLNREANPDEVGYAVLYLASDESTFTTGSEFIIDGGATAL
ncbi:glucose 1-dehydrogenase [Flavobacterium tructae]|uniref:SDR family NAD(P)-dependent oxidoreductase n=1 Tax=Flavobacterium tructae TaxID=1114873 RepID=UPI002551FCE1|nr:glucose 1-dehydrogenase [Flavobacterium tructae]MDL2141690.1 glucose 1-dehydrogenase [Flavobacterium tructae]